jgi:hypothetical protein
MYRFQNERNLWWFKSRRQMTTMKRIVLLIIAVLVLQMLPLSQIEASPNSSIIGLAWHAEYYDNQYLIGPAALVREEGALNYNWGANRPVDGVPADYFTARWTTHPTLDAGRYRFSILADDSVKLTVDYQNVVIDTMDAPKAGQTLSVELNLTAGPHYFQVDYRCDTGKIGWSEQSETRHTIAARDTVCLRQHQFVARPKRSGY